MMRSFESLIKNRGIFLAVVFAAIALHIFAAVRAMPNKFDDEPGAGAFGGIRLHYLNVWNFDFSKGVSAPEGTSHILDNFIKSAVSGTHGLLNFAHWYVYTAIYDVLGVPINEFWLLFAQTLVMAAALLIICLLIGCLYDSRLAALLFIVIASQVYTRYSASFYIIPANTLMEGLLLYILYRYNFRKDDLATGSCLMILLFLNSASGNIIKLPLFALFAWCVIYKSKGFNVFKALDEYLIKKPANLIFAAPIAAAVLGHLYVCSRIGSSNLGMIGWISQKIGLGMPAVSKFGMLRESLEKLIFNKTLDWRIVIAISGFYAVSVMRGKRRTPLLLFPFIYYLYLVNLEPNSAMLGCVILISIAISEGFSIIKGIKKGGLRKFSYVFMAMLTAYALLNLACSTLHSLLKTETPRPNYLKSVGFFLRENMSKDDKIASLLSERENILNEYYYGKGFFKSPVFGKGIYDYKNLTEPESPSNPVSPSEIDGEFGFYVVSCKLRAENQRYSDFIDSLVKKYSLNKVADIAQSGIVYASVYSSRPIEHIELDIEKANAAFDKKYANLKNIFYNRHVGMASTWGYY
ncbi:MAG: hypothetical protein V1933_07105 [Candidatus Omnitrophota bacterium]